MAESKGGFLSRLFGGGGGSTPAAEEPEIYKDLEIRAAPRNEGGRWLTAGTISKPGDEAAVHEFIRADTHTSREDAVDFTVRKAKQIIDEQGDALFK